MKRKPVPSYLWRHYMPRIGNNWRPRIHTPGQSFVKGGWSMFTPVTCVYKLGGRKWLCTKFSQIFDFTLNVQPFYLPCCLLIIIGCYLSCFFLFFLKMLALFFAVFSFRVSLMLMNVKLINELLWECIASLYVKVVRKQIGSFVILLYYFSPAVLLCVSTLSPW